MTPRPIEPVVEPISASNMLSLVARLLSSIRKLIIEKEAADSRFVKLGRLVEEEKEVRLLLQ